MSQPGPFKPLRRLGFLLVVFFFGSNDESAAQQLATPQWQVGAWQPESPSFWPLSLTSQNNNPQADSIRPATIDANGIELNAYATAQYSPGTSILGPLSGWPSAGGLGWRAGLNLNGGISRLKWDCNLEHWRVGGVNEDDWNEAWQWATWDGMGWAWNPNQKDISIARAVGSIAYRISPSIEISAGNTQHHWGNGWRSLWIDRQAGALPFIQLSADAGRVHYVHLMGRTQHRSVGSPPDFPGSGQNSPGTYALKRHAWFAAHAVEAEFGQAWKGSLFGAVTWLASDSGYARRFEGSYAIPFAAFRPTEYALGSADNALIGASLAWNPRWAENQLRVSSQILLDEMVIGELLSDQQWWANKWGALATVTWNSKDKHWQWVNEICAVRPYTYSHASTAQSWTHNRQPLAHPAGSNFAEIRTHLRWSNDRWVIHGAGVGRRAGIDEVVNPGEEPSFSVGSNPLLSYIHRPADYGVNWFYTGDGTSGASDAIDLIQIWLDVAYRWPILGNQEGFIRFMRTQATGDYTDTRWWRMEFGLRFDRVLEERNW